MRPPPSPHRASKDAPFFDSTNAKALGVGARKRGDASGKDLDGEGDTLAAADTEGDNAALEPIPPH